MKKFCRYLSLALLLALPASAAPRKKAPAPAPKKPVPAMAPEKPVDPLLLSEGKETVLVDHLKAEGTTVVLFYRPSEPDEVDLADALKKRVGPERTVALKLVKLASVEAPIAKQYEVTATPLAFVYDRNKNLLGKATNFTEVGVYALRGMRTARIKWVNEDDPNAAQVFRKFGGGARPAPEIMKTMSLRPEIMEAVHDLSRFHFTDGFLPRQTHEMIASYVSTLNKCKY